MSTRAEEGLRAAVRSNPFGAAGFLGILREHPDWVMYKPDDEYGPLALMFKGLARRTLSSGIVLPSPATPLTPDELDACRTWNEEWLGGAFSKQELAESIATMLAESGGASAGFDAESDGVRPNRPGRSLYKRPRDDQNHGADSN